MEAHTFSEEQLNWLSYIKEHLIEKPGLSRGKIFDIMPVFERHGGLTKARQNIRG